MNLLDDDQETWEIEENVGNRTLREKNPQKHKPEIIICP